MTVSQDFAVTNTVAPGAQNNVHIFRGDCSGPFAVVTTQGGQVRAGELASAIVARDFTGDGLVDLARRQPDCERRVRLLRGKGDGTMAPIGGDNVSRMPIALAAARFRSRTAATTRSPPTATPAPTTSLCCPTARAIRAAIRSGRQRSRRAERRRCAATATATASARRPTWSRSAARSDGRRRVPGRRHRAAIVPYDASPGVDANGDGRVDAQDRVAVAHRIFGGA